MSADSPTTCGRSRSRSRRSSESHGGLGSRPFCAPLRLAAARPPLPHSRRPSSKQLEWARTHTKPTVEQTAKVAQTGPNLTHTCSTLVSARTMSGEEGLLIEEADVFKATSNSDVVVVRRLRLYPRFFTTYHDIQVRRAAAMGGPCCVAVWARRAMWQGRPYLRCTCGHLQPTATVDSRSAAWSTATQGALCASVHGLCMLQL
jgi:hypothetical protein